MAKYRESASSRLDRDGEGSASKVNDPFTFDADAISETKIEDKNLVLNTVASVKGSHRGGPKFKDKLNCPLELGANVNKDDMSPLENFYANKLHCGTVVRDLNVRDLLTEALIRDKMCRDAFFGGGHFFGLGIHSD